FDSTRAAKPHVASSMIAVIRSPGTAPGMNVPTRYEWLYCCSCCRSSTRTNSHRTRRGVHLVSYWYGRYCCTRTLRCYYLTAAIAHQHCSVDHAGTNTELTVVVSLQVQQYLVQRYYGHLS
ncbi:unnamed protein product, partial [Laminaria digitata]